MISSDEGYGSHTDMPVESVTIVVPCYNEAPAIEGLCERLLPVLKKLQSRRKVQLLCIDDGSTDDTLALLRKCFEHAPGITTDIVSHPTNLGLPESLRTAFSAAQGDIVCTIDANLSYAPEELQGMIERIESSGADIVAGSPFHAGGTLEGQPAWRIEIARWVNFFNAGLLPGKLSCYTRMFRAYRRQRFAPETLHLSEFISLEQILVDAVIAGAKVVDFPIAVRRRTRAFSAIRWLQSVLRHFLLVARVQMQRYHGKRGPRPGHVALRDEVKRRPSV